MSDDKTQDKRQSAEADDFIVRTVDDFQQQILDNREIIAQYDAQHGKHEEAAAVWTQAGELRSYTQDGARLHLTFENGYGELWWLADDTVRVWYQADNDDFSDDFSYFIDRNFSETQTITVRETDDALRVDCGACHYRIDRQNGTLRIERETLLYNETEGVAWANNGAVSLKTSLQPDEACYGTGERAFDLNLRGRKLSMWNVDPGGFGRGEDPVDTCITFYLGVHDHGGYGLLWDNPARGVFDLGASNHDTLQLSAETGALRYFVFAGGTAEQTLRRYTQLTGRMPMPPLWALGYHQSRYSYFNADDVLETAKTLRERQIPCDALYLDIHYMNDYKIFTWDREAFPDMGAMIEQLHDMGFKIVPIIDPGVKIEKGYSGYESGVERGAFITYPDGEPAAGVVWPGLCHYPDFTDPDTRKWWGEQLSGLLDAGIDGLWNDMNEPLLFDVDAPPRELPDYTRHEVEGRGGDHLTYHNLYGTLMAQASREALEKARPEKRQFVITRAAAAGAQRVSSGWTGDNHSTWDELALSLPMTLQMGLSGMAFTGADIGGFGDDTTGELLARWTQAGALLPFFRNHSAVDTIRQEPWRFEEIHENAIRSAIELRYQLMPYLYTAFAQHAFDGLPIVRPLFMAEPQNTALRDIDDCYLVGDKLLVAPVLQSHRMRRTVYLPDGDWYDFHTHQRYHGGQLLTVAAPLDRLPLFVRSGTVLPLWPVMQHMGEFTLKTLPLRVYADTGETVVYEDAGEGLGYQQGDYRWVRYLSEESSHTLRVSRSIDGDYQPPYERIELQFLGNRQAIEHIEVDGVTLKKWDTQDDMTVVTVPADFKTVTYSI